MFCVTDSTHRPIGRCWNVLKGVVCQVHGNVVDKIHLLLGFVVLVELLGRVLGSLLSPRKPLVASPPNLPKILADSREIHPKACL